MKCLVKGDYCFAAYSVLDLISIQCLDILLMAKNSRCQLQTGSEAVQTLSGGTAASNQNYFRHTESA